jgi:mRNA interferase MazF
MKFFHEWNKCKIEIDSQDNIPKNYPKEGEVWVIKIGINIGVEQDGSTEDFTRPALIVKKFNNQMYWVIPLSSKQKSFDFYYNFTDPSNYNVSVVLAQLRLSSSKRFIRKMYEINNTDFLVVKEKLIKFLS